MKRRFLTWILILALLVVPVHGAEDYIKWVDFNVSYEAMDKAPDAEGGIDAARYYREEIVRRMEEARQSIDQLESLTAAKYWPYPTYADILFSV